MTRRYAGMRLTDLDDVVRLELSVYTHPWSRGNFADALAAGNSAWVVREDGMLLGYCVVMMAPDDAHLLNISVASQAQGQGVGRGLLAWVDAQAAAHGVPSVLLEVRVSNERALRIYEKAGYRRIGQRRGYYPAVGGREDAIVMRKMLNVDAVPAGDTELRHG